MRVSVLHNKSAGSENHAADEIESALRRAGYDVVAVTSELDDLLATLAAQRCDLVVVAGGDGTVSRTSCALAGRGIPLAILPLGTANNTALTLGVPLAVEGELDSVVASWKLGTQRSFDLATLQQADQLAPFSEAMGWGLFPAVMAKANDLKAPTEREHTLERDRRLFQRMIETARPARYELSVDGRTASGEYLMVEIVNIPYIGPQLELSPTSDPGDGYLELVLAGESERTLLLELAACGTIASEVRLPTRRATQISVRSAARTLHVDGELVELSEPGAECSVTVEEGAVRYVIGGSGRQG